MFKHPICLQCWNNSIEHFDKGKSRMFQKESQGNPLIKTTKKIILRWAHFVKISILCQMKPIESTWNDTKKNVHDWQNRCNETFADQESRQPSNQDYRQDHSTMSTFCENIKYVTNESNEINLKWYTRNIYDWSKILNNCFASWNVNICIFMIPIF